MCNPLWGAVCSCRRSRRTWPWSSFSSVSVTPPRTKRCGPSSVQKQPHPARAPQRFHCTKYSGTKWKRGLISVVENLICTCRIMSLFVRTCQKLCFTSPKCEFGSFYYWRRRYCDTQKQHRCTTS